MTIVSDYSFVNATLGAGVKIDETVTSMNNNVSPATVRCSDDPTSFCGTFSTGGRETSTAILMMQVSGLTFATTATPPRVFINGDFIGAIQPVRFEDAEDRTAHADHWYTQYIVFGGSILNRDTPNVLKVTGATYDDPTPTPGNLKDGFRLLDVVCWFKQEV